MKNFFSRFLVRAFFVSVASLSLLFVSCSSSEDDGDEVYYERYPVLLSDSDPIRGVYSTKNYSDYGTDVAFIFRPTIAYATCASVDALSSVDDLERYVDFIENPNTYATEKYLSLKDSNDVYVVYNAFSDADVSDGIQENEIDKHSGVIIFKAKYSPYGSPSVGCYYGVKFQFLDSDGNIPEKTKKSTVFGNKVFIEGGYSSATEYNNVKDLDKAVLMFGFENTSYFNSDSWTSSSSGAEKTSRTSFSESEFSSNIFVKAD